MTASSDGDFNDFLHVLSECDTTVLTSEQLKALVFVSGYAVSKVLPLTDCTVCKHDFTMNKKLQVEGTKDCYTYLSALDRGGLIWPTDRAVEITTQMYKVFQEIISKECIEQRFLSCSNQRQVLMKLSLKRIGDLGLCSKKCDECGRHCLDLVKKFCKPTVNIFLNNYSKHFCEKSTSGSSMRKVQTFK